MSKRKLALALAVVAWARRRKRGKRMSEQKIVKVTGGKFEGGRLLFTPGTMDLLAEGYNLFQPLARHFAGDWGDLSEQDQIENNLSVKRGYRILSAYNLGDDVRIWIITEADRSATTILLPEEY